MKDRWTGALGFRWTDEMRLENGDPVDSVLYADLRISYTPQAMNERWTVSLGFNNLFDEDPPLCFPCGVIGMSLVAHGPARPRRLPASQLPALAAATGGFFSLRTANQRRFSEYNWKPT